MLAYGMIDAAGWLQTSPADALDIHHDGLDQDQDKRLGPGAFVQGAHVLTGLACGAMLLLGRLHPGIASQGMGLRHILLKRHIGPNALPSHPSYSLRSASSRVRRDGQATRGLRTHHDVFPRCRCSWQTLYPHRGDRLPSAHSSS